MNTEMLLPMCNTQGGVMSQPATVMLIILTGGDSTADLRKRKLKYHHIIK